MAPKAPKATAKKAAPKEMKVAGGKAPFNKPRKAPALKKKLESWSQEDWDRDVVGRQFATEEWKVRRVKADIKKKASVNAAANAVHIAAMCSGSTGPGWSQGSGSSVSASDVSSNMVSRAEKSDQLWKSLLSKQDEEIELEKARVVVKKRKEDFMILTVDTSNMDDEVKAAHLFYHDMILGEIITRRAAAAEAAAAAASASAASTAGSAAASAAGSVYEQQHPPETHDDIIDLEEPASTSTTSLFEI